MRWKSQLWCQGCLFNEAEERSGGVIGVNTGVEGAE